MGAIQNSVNQVLGTVAGAATIAKHLKNQENQTKATKDVSSKIDKVQEKWNNVPDAGQKLQNAQATRKAVESLLNAQYPFRNLKGWKAEDQLNPQRLNDFNNLMKSYNTAKEAELTAGLELNQGLTTTLTEENEEVNK